MEEEGHGGEAGHTDGAEAADAAEKDVMHVIDVFVMSVKCGNCDAYQTLVDWRPGPERNGWVYRCEGTVCDAQVTETIIEVPTHLDRSDRRWHELHYPAKPGSSVADEGVGAALGGDRGVGAVSADDADVAVEGE